MSKLMDITPYLESIIQLGEVIALLRYYSPAVECYEEQTDWNRFTVEAIHRLLRQPPTTTALQDRMSLFSSIISPAVAKEGTFFFNSRGISPSPDARLMNDNDGITQVGVPQQHWLHRGLQKGQGKSSTYRSTLCEEGQNIPQRYLPSHGVLKLPTSSQPWHQVPLSVLSGQGLDIGFSFRVLLPKHQEVKRQRDHLPAVMVTEEKEICLQKNDFMCTSIASVLLLAAPITLFYPNFPSSLTRESWRRKIVPQTVVEASKCSTVSGVVDVLRQCMASLKDGHVHVKHLEATSRRFYPIDLTVLSESDPSVIVTAVNKHTGDLLRVGDRLVLWNNQPMASVLQSLLRRVSSSTPLYAFSLALQLLVQGTDSVEVVVERRQSNGGAPQQEPQQLSVIKATLFPVNQSNMPWECKPEQFTEVAAGVGYYNLDRESASREEEWSSHVRRLHESFPRGLIFDLRGYPNAVSKLLLAHLVPPRGEVVSAFWQSPISARPIIGFISEDLESIGAQKGAANDADFLFSTGTWDPIASCKPFLGNRPVAFIIDRTAISYAESILAIVEHYKLATLVGERTAGTNGNMTDITLPNRVFVSWTGMRVLRHDGVTPHNTSGLAVTANVGCARTWSGIAAGRDEFLETAIEVISTATNGM